MDRVCWRWSRWSLMDRSRWKLLFCLADVVSRPDQIDSARDNSGSNSCRHGWIHGWKGTGWPVGTSKTASARWKLSFAQIQLGQAPRAAGRPITGSILTCLPGGHHAKWRCRGIFHGPSLLVFPFLVSLHFFMGPAYHDNLEAAALADAGAPSCPSRHHVTSRMRTRFGFAGTPTSHCIGFLLALESLPTMNPGLSNLALLLPTRDTSRQIMRCCFGRPT